MPWFSSHRLASPLTLFGLAFTVALLAGCATDPPPGNLADANAAYDRGDYERSYAIAAYIASGEPSLDQDDAAYVAGLSAGEMGNEKKAIKYLKQATASFDKPLAADAGVMLGLAYTSQERYSLAVDALLKAAPDLQGEDQAKAYFYAAISQQKLGRWARARDNLILSKAKSSDEAFRAQISEQLAVNGYTIQLGSYEDGAAAQAAADTLAPQASAVGIGAPRLVPNPGRPGQTLVHVGRFSTYSSALAFREQLGTPDAFIVPITARQPR